MQESISPIGSTTERCVMAEQYEYQIELSNARESIRKWEAADEYHAYSGRIRHARDMRKSLDRALVLNEDIEEDPEYKRLDSLSREIVYHTPIMPIDADDWRWAMDVIGRS